jgi:hypothetical protein
VVQQVVVVEMKTHQACRVVAVAIQLHNLRSLTHLRHHSYKIDQNS